MGRAKRNPTIIEIRRTSEDRPYGCGVYLFSYLIIGCASLKRKQNETLQK